MPRIALERHAYAPELNRAHLLGRDVSLPAPGCSTIREARARLFPRPALPFLHAVVRSCYPEPWAHLDRTYGGRVASRRAALDFARDLRRRNPGGPLLDGRILPPASVTVTVRVIG